MPGMLFTLTGRDELSDVFDDIGDAARRMHRRISTATTEADRELRRLGRTTSTTLAGMRRDGDAGAKAMAELGKVTKMLWPAAIPAAASLAPIAAGAGTVAVAVGAMTAAMIPQIAALGEVSEAQKAYDDAVDKSGATSQEAAQAQAEYARVVAKLPPATRQAAAAVGVLKDNYKQWSDSLAGATMTPFTKGVALVNTLLPKTTGLVKVASGEADRFMTVLGGQLATPGLDAANTKFTAFAEKTLRKVNDEIVHLMRVSDGGEVGGPAREFMTWARAQGPTVASVLSSVASALVHVLEAGSGVGVGLLQVVEVAARLVSAVPAGTIALFLQLALALKLTKAAALGMAAARTALAGFGASLVAMSSAAAATPGRLAAVRAAISALSRTTKVAMAGTGIGLLVLALSELSQRGRQAPPDVDKLTSSLKELGATGKVTGEAAAHFGSDLDGLYDKVRSLTDPSTLDSVQQFLVGWTGWDSTPVKEAKENLDSVDQSLASLVSAGHADLAAAALKRLTAEYAKGGRDTSDLTGKLDAYKSALADAKFEQELAAAAQGLFGAQAQSVQAKLDAQRASADGLRQSIQALNDVNRAGLGGMIGFEAAIDATAKAAKDNAGALTMSHGVLDLNSAKAQAAATALQDLASKTDAAAGSARESGSSWETVNGIYSRGRAELIKNAQAMGLNKTEAAALADQILKIPDKTTTVSMRKEDAQRDLEAFNAAVKRSPGTKSVTINALTQTAQKLLESLGYKVTRLPSGKVTVTTGGGALRTIGDIRAALNSIDGKTARTTVTTVRQTVFTTQGSPSKVAPAHRDYARGGQVRGYAGGGDVQFAPTGLLSGPGTGTSDSILALLASGAVARVSATEFVVNAKSTKRYRPLLEAINNGTLNLDRFRSAGLAGGGLAGAGADAARGLALGLTGSTGTVDGAARAMAAAVVSGVKAELQIASPSKKTKALADDVGKGFIIGLTGSQSKIRSVAADLAKDIRTAFSGRKESSLISWVNKQTNALLSAAAKRDKIASQIAAAKAYQGDLQKRTRESGYMSQLGLDDEQVTAGSIKAGLASKLAKLRQFTKYIDILKKQGLRGALLRQILDMGPEQGYAYASALVGAGKGTLSQINSLDKQLESGAVTLGRNGADALWDAGKNAGRGFLAGLESQKKDIENLMLRIAKSMQSAIKKSLGIKSPSTVMAQLGRFSTQGLAAGLASGLPQVDQAMRRVATRVAGAPIGTPVAGRPAVAAVGGQVINVRVDVRDAMDPVAVAREVQRLLLQLGRTHGTKVSLNLGGV